MIQRSANCIEFGSFLPVCVKFLINGKVYEIACYYLFTTAIATTNKFLLIAKLTKIE
jgi:hypothetical protein